ncbi:DUF4178 domain-containing protein [Chryseobacterium sp. JUb7]|uniref:DUF4178 domain-containing protein n=1 Tax=Chryseobacterium sp. JUb7 TaxID=2940599 RepID=UPI002169F975|nr:DUF4178 domain-containing protein [Chryseobacterium sp. JUb7]MCS3530959.1 hypothetical protein [Chryseobacterium sp. JUb7]
MHYTCPLCKTENKIDATFHIEEYVCKSCSNLIDVDKNTSTKVVKKPIENVVLEIGQKGIIAEVEYTVTGIIIRKYGTHIFWREYYLKDYKGNDAFLSESDGHWVFLHSIHEEDIKKKSNGKVAELHTLNYRWYETTQCNIYAAAGFFDDHLNFGIATYKEYVNGTQMISQEQSGKHNECFFGRHISKYKVKNAFKIPNLPNYSGIGIVQPYYVNIKQAINILCIAALMICLLQFYVYTTRTNYSVFEQKIKFEDVKNKEMVSKSFTLSGGSAPLKVKVFSGVDNSWANVQLSLVNEKTNEAVYTSKDIEEYHGVEGGESWSEGNKTEEFNLCGVSSGTYHFAISAERQEIMETVPASTYITPDGLVNITKESSGMINVVINGTMESVTFGNLKTLEEDESEIGKLVRKSTAGKNLDSLLNINVLAAQIKTEEPATESNSVEIKATWLPVSFWNFGFILVLMIVFFIICYWGRYFFNVSKWKNSSNSPYPQS